MTTKALKRSLKRLALEVCHENRVGPWRDLLRQRRAARRALAHRLR